MNAQVWIGSLLLTSASLFAACNSGLNITRPDAGTDSGSLIDAAIAPDAASVAISPMTIARSLFGVGTTPDGRVLVFDGYTETSVEHRAEIYSPVTNSWTPAASAPTTRYALSSVTGSDGKIYALGGTPSGTVALALFEAYDPSKNSWSSLPLMPTARIGAAAAAAPDGRIFVIGGRDSNKLQIDSVDVFTPSSQTWAAGPPIPTSRFGATAVTGSDGRIYVLGGRDQSDTPLDTVEALDPALGQWSTEPSMPTPRFWFGTASTSNGHLYTLGGLRQGSRPGSRADDFLDSVDDYDIAKKSWSSRAPMLEPRGWLELALLPDGRILALGGSPPGPGAYPPPTSRSMAYNPTTDQWSW